MEPVNQQNITLLTFGVFEEGFIEQIAKGVEHEFLIPVAIREVHMDLNDFFEPARKQYNGNKLLTKVASMAPEESMKTVGLFQVDLFIPILTYIFGQAHLNGPAAIVSLYRLINVRYGMSENDMLLRERAVKEIIHELGHTFGLVHCHTPTCVMRSGTYVEDIDQKDRHLCHLCRDQVSLLKSHEPR